VQVDIILEPDSPTRFKQLGLLAESFGFGAVWTANHVGARDPFMSFMPLAAASERIRMGPVAVSPFELHPVKMANQLLTLNEASAGRASIIVGGGGGALIAMGLKTGRRVMHPQMLRGVRECVEMLRAAASGSLVNYHGDVFEVSGYYPGWARDQAPLIYIGASKPKMLALAATVADGVMLSDVTLARMPETMLVLNDALQQQGRDPQGFRISNLYSWHVKADAAAAMDEARRKLWVRGMLERWYISTFLNDEECTLVEEKFDVFANAYINNTAEFPGVPEALANKLVRELTFTGTPDDVDGFIDQLLAFKAAGLTEFGIRLYDQPEDSIKMIGERVLPALR
jgi:alkanesulfonate monooxygenase SsuD/methylene tetrahydromethanopterin reductase-like flavin-dependent oxidoreductase (luciferase family)